MPSERPSNRKRYLIGSGTACDVVLSDKSVSRSHGCLIVEPDGSGKLFISYRRFDTEQATGRIFDFLVGRYGKERVFFDTETIPVAGDFRKMGATMPSARRLPPAIRPIVNINAANVRAGRDFQSDMDFIAQTIDQYAKPSLLEATGLESPYLPEALQQKLLNVLITLTLEVVAIQMHGRVSELPVEEINWSQAPKYLWNDLISLAVRNRKVESFIHNLASSYNGNVQIRQVEEEVGEWSNSANSREKSL